MLIDVDKQQNLLYNIYRFVTGVAQTNCEEANLLDLSYAWAGTLCSCLFLLKELWFNGMEKFCRR